MIGYKDRRAVEEAASKGNLSVYDLEDIEIVHSTALKQWLKVECRMLKDSPISTSHCL